MHVLKDDVLFLLTWEIGMGNVLGPQERGCILRYILGNRS